jgi:hypothetical protein
MTMRPRVRKLALVAHVVSSVGWLGTVGAFLALAIAGLFTNDAGTVRAVYPSMELLGWLVIVPCSVAALVTGLIVSLGTEWGLVRYYWVATKFMLTLGATGLLLVHMSVVQHAAGIASGAVAAGRFRNLQVRLVFDAALALLVLLTNTVLSIYKPWGMTAHGRRVTGIALPAGMDADRSPRKSWAVALAFGVVLLFIVLLHLTGLAGHH